MSTGLVADTISFSHVDGPGNRFVVFLQGCNFDCIACHNPQTIPGHAMVEGHHPRHMGVPELLDDIRRAAPFVSGVTVSGGEATQQAGFVHALFAAIKADRSLSRLTCLLDSNGACALDTWDQLAPVMDGAMIDLKCLDDDIHRAMTASSNDRVLASIGHLVAIDRLYEVRLLLVAGLNDDDELVYRTGRWLAELDPHMRVTVLGFRSHGARPQAPPLLEPERSALERATALLAGLADFRMTLV